LRDFFIWGSALLFLLAALHTVAVRQEVYEHARRIGVMQERLRETRRGNDNLALARERLASPATLRRRAEEQGLVASGEVRR